MREGRQQLVDATKGCAPIPSEVGSTRPVIVRPNHQVDFRSSLYFYYIETRCIVSYPRSGPESNRGHTHGGAVLAIVDHARAPGVRVRLLRC